MVRNILSVIFGLIIGMAFNMAVIQLNTSILFPMPEGTDMNDTAQFNEYLATLPAMAFIVTIVAHLGQSLIGAWVAARCGASRPMFLAMIVGVLSLAGGVMAMGMFEGPDWMIVELPLYLVFAWCAGRAESQRRAATGP